MSKAEEFEIINDWIKENHPDPDSLFTGDLKVDNKIRDLWFPVIKAFAKHVVDENKSLYKCILEQRDKPISERVRELKKQLKKIDQ